MKGLRYDDNCPKCGYKTNNPDFVRTLHENLHLTEALKFSGLAKDSLPVPATTNLPHTMNHEDIYHNSDRVAKASIWSGNNNNNNSTYKERQKMIDNLNRILGLTYSSRGLL